MRLWLLTILILSPYVLAYDFYSDYFIFENNHDSQYNEENEIVVYDYTEEKHDPDADCFAVETYHDFQICYLEEGHTITHFND